MKLLEVLGGLADPKNALLYLKRELERGGLKARVEANTFLRVSFGDEELPMSFEFGKDGNVLMKVPDEWYNAAKKVLPGNIRVFPGMITGKTFDLGPVKAFPKFVGALTSLARRMIAHAKYTSDVLSEVYQAMKAVSFPPGWKSETGITKTGTTGAAFLKAEKTLEDGNPVRIQLGVVERGGGFSTTLDIMSPLPFSKLKGVVNTRVLSNRSLLNRLGISGVEKKSSYRWELFWPTSRMTADRLSEFLNRLLR